MGRAFSEELDSLGDTLTWSTSVDLPVRDSEVGPVCGLRVVVGSGGSFTVATALATQTHYREQWVTQALTPLQYVQRADAMPPHSVTLISAEGKNRDILHAARKALSVATLCEVLTFSRGSALAALAEASSRARVLCFEAPWGRDGYLATNSLLASVVLGLRLQGSSIDAQSMAAFLALYRTTSLLDFLAAQVAVANRLLVLHGTHGMVASVDLESKLSEAAFAFVQMADFRQFAHGRHIQLEKPGHQVPVIAFVSPTEQALWRATRDEMPSGVTVVECDLPAEQAAATVSGLLAVMALVEKIASVLGQDPGQPTVPGFARRIHALDTSSLLSQPAGTSANPKLASLEGVMTREAAEQAGNRYLDRLRQARFAALVLDFDGTMCETAKREAGLDPRLVPIVTGLLRAGITIAFASGRGNSLHENLREHLPTDTWEKCLLGCYSGSLVTPLAQPWPQTVTDPLLAALQLQLEQLGIDKDNGFKLSARMAQLTIRTPKGDGVDNLFALCSNMVNTRAGWRVYRSAHSVDILAPAATKNAVVHALVLQHQFDPLNEVCRIGDRGETHGNDSELLAQGLTLSVDGVSEDPDACWFFGESAMLPVERAAHYLGSLVVRDFKAHFDERVLQLWQKQLA